MTRWHGIGTFLSDISAGNHSAKDNQPEPITQSSRVSLSSPFSIDLTILSDSSQSSPSISKRNEVVKKDQGTITDPILLSREQFEQKLHKLIDTNSDFFYMPMYRQYFGSTPPDPRLYNPQLLDEYMDWYMNVYLDEDLPWQWIDVDYVQAKVDESKNNPKKNHRN